MMTPERALHDFMEKYPADAISSIDNLSRDVTLSMSHFNGISFTESVTQFKEFLEGYVLYKTEHVNDGDSADKIILEQSDDFIKNKLFGPMKIPYTKVSSFIEGYLNHLSELCDTENNTVKSMLEHGIDNSSVGIYETMICEYVSVLTERVDNVMDKLLLASGYTTSNYFDKLKRAKPVVKTDNSYFL